MNPESQNDRLAGAALPKPFPVPIRVTGGPDAALPAEVATFFWVDGRGEVAKTLPSVPIQNGVALYSGPPLPQGARWAITVHDSGGLPIFRSGPLTQLPGPASDIAALGSRISVFRVSTGANFGIDSPDGASSLVRRRLTLLPTSLRVDSVNFSADSAGREIVNVTGRVQRFFFFWMSFTHSLSLTLRPGTKPGHPEEIVIVETAGPGTGGIATLGSLAAVLDQAILEGVTTALNAAVKGIAAGQLALFGAGFAPTLVSVTQIAAVPIFSDPQINVVVHGGTITGGTVVATQ